MNIIAVDDERASLWAIGRAVKEAAGLAEFHAFLSASEALDYAGSHAVDVAFLDIEMAEMSGLDLAKRLKDIRGGTNIIFVTGFSSYMENAFRMRVSGYVVKPVDAERVRDELEHLRAPLPLRPDRGLRIQCFGNFEVFFDGVPIVFRRPKAKEALAYLVDRRGAEVSKKELAAVLWENEPYTRSLQSHLFKLIEEMVRALREAGVEDFVLIRRGVYAVNPEKARCDYFLFSQSDAFAVNSYQGEYMANYSWAEFTAGVLARNQ